MNYFIFICLKNVIKTLRHLRLCSSGFVNLVLNLKFGQSVFLSGLCAIIRGVAAAGLQSVVGQL